LLHLPHHCYHFLRVEYFEALELRFEQHCCQFLIDSVSIGVRVCVFLRAGVSVVNLVVDLGAGYQRGSGDRGVNLVGTELALLFVMRCLCLPHVQLRSILAFKLLFAYLNKQVVIYEVVLGLRLPARLIHRVLPCAIILVFLNYIRASSGRRSNIVDA